MSGITPNELELMNVLSEIRKIVDPDKPERMMQSELVEAVREMKERIIELKKQIKQVRSATYREAAKEVSNHWNDATTLVNQRDQAARSVFMLNKLADDSVRQENVK